MVHFLHWVISSLKYLARNVYINFRLVKSLVFKPGGNSFPVQQRRQFSYEWLWTTEKYEKWNVFFFERCFLKLLSSIIFYRKPFVIWKNLASSWSSQVFVILL